MPTVQEIEQALFDWAPRELAASWDNVGLLAGSGAGNAGRILIALDITEWVADEALACGADLVVSHHPLMNCRWHEVQNIRDDNAQGRTIIKLLRGGISGICMHTNLDAAEGGVNDILARRLGLQAPAAFNEEKIGRIGTLKYEKGLEEFLKDVIQLLDCKGLRYRDAGKPVHRVAVGGGSCAEYISQAIALGCDTFVTSDIKYHDFLDANGINLIDAGHFETENPICEAIKAYLDGRFPGLETVISTSHRGVIQYYT